MKLQKYITLAAILTLSACATGDKAPDLEAVRTTNFKDNQFKESLRVGYLNFVDSEWQKGDKEDARRYSLKAKSLTHNIEPELETLYNRNIELKDLNQLLGAKYYLEAAFIKGVKDVAPVDSAEAQVSFDCWVEEEEERAKKTSKKLCKERFTDVKVKIDAALEAIKKYNEEQEAAERQQQEQQIRQEFTQRFYTGTASSGPAVRTIEVIGKGTKKGPSPLETGVKLGSKTLPDPLLIFFKFNSAELGLTAKNIIAKIARDIEIFNPRKVIITGNTDSVGSYDYNVRLAIKRGQAVADYLEKEFNVNPAILDVKAYGENNPRIEYNETKRDVRNRYVKIVFESDNRYYPQGLPPSDSDSDN